MKFLARSYVVKQAIIMYLIDETSAYEHLNQNKFKVLVF